MHPLILDVALVWLVVLLGITGIALARSRAILDRIVAFDLLSLLLVGILLVLSYRRGEVYYLEAALALALLSFTGTIAAARYVARREGEH